MSQFELIDETGASRFRGSQRPPGGGSQPLDTFTRARLTFTETPGAGTYTATLELPAGASVLDTPVFVIAGPWTADAAALEVGDGVAADSYIPAAEADLVTGGKLVTPYDATSAGLDAKKSWTDSGALLANSVYSKAASMYAGTDYNASVRYLTGDTITATVVATGAYDTGAITASSLADGGTLNAAGDPLTVVAGDIDATGTVDSVTGAFPITGVNQGTQAFTIAGDHAALFTNGDSIRVAGSAGNDGFYTVDTSTFGAGATTVTTVEAIGDPTVGGVLIPVTGGVVTSYTITAGGNGYSVSNGVAVSTGGSGFTIDITAVTPTAFGRLVVDVLGFGVPPGEVVAVKS